MITAYNRTQIWFQGKALHHKTNAKIHKNHGKSPRGKTDVDNPIYEYCPSLGPGIIR